MSSDPELQNIPPPKGTLADKVLTAIEKSKPMLNVDLDYSQIERKLAMRLDELNLLDVGNKIGLVGAVFGDNDDTYLCMFPDQEVADNQEVLDMDLEDWKKFLRQVDLLEIEVLQKTKDGKLAKAILRKTQRLIEARVSWAVYKRDNYTCRYCGRDGIPMTVDHLVLWEEGGPSIEANLVTADKRCNKTRGSLPYDQWLKHPYYKKVSANLSEEQKRANEELAKTLGAIPRRYHTRSR